MDSISRLARVFQQEDINFLLTNRIPRRLATRFMGWFSKIEHPLVRSVSIGTLRFFAGHLNLQEAKKTRFTSLHDCFVRELKDGARAIDARPDVLISPCDAIVGTLGTIRGTELIQAKGLAYTLEELLGDPQLAATYRNGRFITLRLTASMYHRFHAPFDCAVDEVIYVSGDTWNVNPVALKRIERLFCKNERAVVETRLNGSRERLTLVPVAAILVASIRFGFLDDPLNLRHNGPNRIPCHVVFQKGDEMGYFAHGSTIIVLATAGLELCEDVREGRLIRMGEGLLRHPAR